MRLIVKTSKRFLNLPFESMAVWINEVDGCTVMASGVDGASEEYILAKTTKHKDAEDIMMKIHNAYVQGKPVFMIMEEDK